MSDSRREILAEILDSMTDSAPMAAVAMSVSLWADVPKGTGPLAGRDLSDPFDMPTDSTVGGW